MSKKTPCLFLLLIIGGYCSMAQRVDLDYLEDYYKSQSLDSCIVPFNDSTKNVDQIILIRHGKPDIVRSGWYNRKEAIHYIHNYDSVGVMPFNPLPLCPDNLNVDTVYFSNIQRAMNTAQLIFEDRYQMKEDTRFREFERKIICFFNIKMPLGFWLTASRGVWMLGFNDKGIESFKEAKHRAKRNALLFDTKSKDEHLIILVAHGLHNKYVAKYLKRLGWEKVRKGGNSYTAVNILAKEVSGEQ